MKKLIIKTLLFSIIIILVIGLLDDSFRPKPTDFSVTINKFNKQNKDSISIIFFGSSHSFFTYNPEVIDEALGTLSYNLGSGGQRLTVTNYLQKQILQNCKPKLIVLDLFPAFASFPKDPKPKGLQLDVFDNMPYSWNKISKISEIYKVNEFPAVVSKMIRNHDLWSERIANDF